LGKGFIGVLGGFIGIELGLGICELDEDEGICFIVK
jgi:hypothetical protein